jgi:hypothetical protein
MFTNHQNNTCNINDRIALRWCLDFGIFFLLTLLCYFPPSNCAEPQSSENFGTLGGPLSFLMKAASLSGTEFNSGPQTFSDLDCTSLKNV